MSANRRRTEISGDESSDGGNPGMSGRLSGEEVAEEARNSRPNLVEEEKEAHADKAGEGDGTFESAGISEDFRQTTGDSEKAGKGRGPALRRLSDAAERGETGGSGPKQLLVEFDNAGKLFVLEDGVGKEEISENHGERGGSEATKIAEQERTEDRIQQSKEISRGLRHLRHESRERGIKLRRVHRKIVVSGRSIRRYCRIPMRWKVRKMLSTVARICRPRGGRKGWHPVCLFRRSCPSSPTLHPSRRVSRGLGQPITVESRQVYARVRSLGQFDPCSSP